MTANIIPYDDAPIVDEKALAKEHVELVTNLQHSLEAGHAGFVVAGKFLSEIHKKKTYLSEDASREVPWDEFLMRPDLPIPGETPAGRRRWAYRIITIWDNIASRTDIDAKRLAKIGYSKLALVAGEIKTNEKADINDWLDQAETLSIHDLSRALGDGDQTLSEKSSCKHENIEKVVRWKCSDCKETFSEDPTKKDAKKK